MPASDLDGEAPSAPTWLDDGERWPDGQLRAEAPPWAVHAMAVARNLWAVLVEHRLYPGEVAAAANVVASANVVSELPADKRGVLS
jgi:hypothetical protein